MRLFCTLIFSFLVLPVASWAATRTAASCSYSDVLSAYNAASEGDIVSIPAGTSTWSSTFNLTKGITIQGAGKASTIIAVNIDPAILVTLSSDVAVRITGIYFKQTNNNSGKTAVRVRPSVYGNILRNIQIDNCKFEKGSRDVNIRGDVYGVIYQNEFINNNIAIGFEGNNDGSWRLPIVAGSSSAMFIEDNTFVINNNADREPNELIYHQEGARSVTRYNTFDASTYTAGAAMFFDSHGQWTPPYRGQPILEIYRNKFNCDNSYRMMNIRGGSVLLHNNSGNCSSNYSFHLDNEQTESWPQPDQVYNSFMWNNTGIPTLYFPNSSSIIQQNRDYFLHAPASSGGKETLINNGLGGMTFTSSGANAYYPYTEYTYPHPLRSGQINPTDVQPPGGLKVLSAP